MLKFAVILVLVCVMFRWAFGKWPWDFAKGPSTRDRELSKARILLKVPANASREEIAAAHKKLLASVHPDRGGTSQEVHAANAARDLLLAELPEPPEPPKGSGSQD